MADYFSDNFYFNAGGQGQNFNSGMGDTNTSPGRNMMCRNMGNMQFQHSQPTQLQNSLMFGEGQNNNEKHTVHWFRKGLRLHDNPSLRDGIRDSKTYRCIFVLDPWFAGSSNVGINKWRFLLQCLEDLDQSLRKLNSRLFVIRGQPADVLPKCFKV